MTSYTSTHPFFRDNSHVSLDLDDEETASRVKHLIRYSHTVFQRELVSISTLVSRNWSRRDINDYYQQSDILPTSLPVQYTYHVPYLRLTSEKWHECVVFPWQLLPVAELSKEYDAMVIPYLTVIQENESASSVFFRQKMYSRFHHDDSLHVQHYILKPQHPTRVDFTTIVHRVAGESASASSPHIETDTETNFGRKVGPGEPCVFAFKLDGASQPTDFAFRIQFFLVLHNRTYNDNLKLAPRSRQFIHDVAQQSTTSSSTSSNYKPKMIRLEDV